MDSRVVNAGRGYHPQQQQLSSYDFSALARWEQSGVGSARSIEVIRAWKEESVAAQRSGMYMDKGNAANLIRTWIENGDPTAPLNLGSCDLLSCPPLPNDVQHLGLSFNAELSTLPQPLPDQLRSLNISFCNFTHLPHQLPASLVELHFTTNKVDRLPDTLPASLQVIYGTNNRIGSLPARLPDGLQKLYLAANLIVELDPGLPLPTCSFLNLCNNKLSDASLALLRAVTGAVDYKGPAVKIGEVNEYFDHSEVLPSECTNELRAEEGPAIQRRKF